MNYYSAYDEDAILAEVNQKIEKRAARQKQTSTTILNNCNENYKKTEELLEKLYAKQKLLAKEILNLQRKQDERRRFLEEF